MMKTCQFGCLFAGQRTKILMPWLIVVLLLTAIAPVGFGQALPAAEASPISTGFALPRAAGTLNYAISASGNLNWGYYSTQGTTGGVGISGDIGYLSNSKFKPFSMIFSGGHSWSLGNGQPSYSYLNLGLSQVLNLKRWNIVLSDSISYLPGTPTVGLSGVPGTGDLGINPVQVGVDTGQGVLSDYSTRVANTASGSVQREITGKTSFNAFGSYGITRFSDTPGREGLDSDYETGGGGVSHQISARDSFGGSYSYSRYAYAKSSINLVAPGFVSQTASFQVTHQFSRKFSVSASAGPEWTAIDTGNAGQAVSVYANASASYTGRTSNVTASYVRGTNSGYGVLGGTLSQGATVVASRTFGRVWNASASAGFTQSSALPVAGVARYTFDTTVGGVQVSRALVRTISVYASYTAEHQSNQGATIPNVFSGLEQVVGFGVTYSPNSLHFGRQ